MTSSGIISRRVHQCRLAGTADETAVLPVGQDILGIVVEHVKPAAADAYAPGIQILAGTAALGADTPDETSVLGVLVDRFRRDDVVCVFGLAHILDHSQDGRPVGSIKPYDRHILDQNIGRYLHGLVHGRPIENGESGHFGPGRTRGQHDGRENKAQNFIHSFI